MKYASIALIVCMGWQLSAKESILNSRKLCEIPSQNQRIIIATNLEDILIAKDWFSIIASGAHGFWNAQNKGQILKLLFSYSFLRDCYRANKKTLSPNGTLLLHKSDYIAYFTRTYPALAGHEEELFDMLHEYSVAEEMIAFYLWLKVSKNYALFVATNKNKASYIRIKTKLDTSLRKKFGIGWDDLFDGAFYVDKINKKNGEPFTLSAKPDVHYFLGFWNYLSSKCGYFKEKTHVMYIDDAEPNIVGAQAANYEYDIPIDGVYYQNPNQIKHAIMLLAESLEKNAHGNLE